MQCHWYGSSPPEFATKLLIDNSLISLYVNKQQVQSKDGLHSAELQ